MILACSRLSVPISVPFLLASLAGLAACDRKPAPPPPPPPAKVGFVTLKQKSVVLTTELPGRTEAFLTADVRPQVSGVVTRRSFIEGSDVKLGQQLYQIDPATYKAAYDTAMATLQYDRAALATARAKTARYKPLAAAQAVSRQDYDDAVATSGEAVANIATAMASIEQANINLAYTKVMAPIAGRIGRSSVTPGALVTADQTTALATITQLDPIYVDVTQPATTLLRLQQELAAGKLQRIGPNEAKVTLLLEDGSSYDAPGILQFSEVTVDEGTGTVLLRAIFPNHGHRLLPGLYVRAELREGTDNNAILAPQQGVSRNPHGDATVMLVGPGNKAEQRVVQATQAIGSNWLVTSGLAAGDKLIVDGLQQLRPGMEVQPTETTEVTSAGAAQ
jgi:membrane fusion protein (multidrug efflux system)